MAITLLTHAAASGQQTATTAAIDTTGASLLVVVTTQYASESLNSLADSKGNTWVALTTKNDTLCISQIYYAVNPVVGTGHTFTYAGTNVFASVMATAWSGTLTSSPFDVQNGATGGNVTTFQPGSVTPSQANSLVITGITIDAASTVSIDSGFTISDQVAFTSGNNFGGASAYLIQTTASAINPTWTLSPATSLEAATIAVFKPTVAGSLSSLGRRPAPIQIWDH